MSDLIQRLRLHCGHNRDHEWPYNLLREAADKIERLTNRDIARSDTMMSLLEERGHLWAEIERLQAHRDALQDECDEWADTCAKQKAVVDAQARRLRTVMTNEPIASYELRCNVADQLAAALETDAERTDND